MSAHDIVFCDYSQVQAMGSLILIGLLSLFHLAAAQVTGMYYITVWIVCVYSILCMCGSFGTHVARGLSCSEFEILLLK